jgi:hypothetical protein
MYVKYCSRYTWPGACITLVSSVGLWGVIGNLEFPGNGHAPCGVLKVKVGSANSSHSGRYNISLCYGRFAFASGALGGYVAAVSLLEPPYRCRAAALPSLKCCFCCFYRNKARISPWLGWAYLAQKMQSPQPRPSQPPSNSALDTEKWAPESAADRS